ncbi:hypothetical protein I316_07144 [Kwoniella heveanensis BCC8398]|uniref:Uncharacterized protein n=1 Tax=Kwoniella heveanensis BCC8398 TaxID=1296120 RepID=A0A1B9GJN1_9TREE|nr:hypothetical protein I316_07144 [Kwoniella heveanensis BCC8398]
MRGVFQLLAFFTSVRTSKGAVIIGRVRSFSTQPVEDEIALSRQYIPNRTFSAPTSWTSWSPDKSSSSDSASEATGHGLPASFVERPCSSPPALGPTALTAWDTITIASAISPSSIPTVWSTQTITSALAAVSKAESTVATVWDTVYSTVSPPESSPSTVWTTETSYLPTASKTPSEDASTSPSSTFTPITENSSSSTAETTTSSSSFSASASTTTSSPTTDDLVALVTETVVTTTTLSPTPTNAPFGFLTYKYGQNVIMTDVKANNQKYKSKAGNNYNPDWYTVNLLTDKPTHSRRIFEFFKPNDKGDFGPDVEDSKIVTALACEFTFHPGNADNRPVFAVWDAAPWYYQWDPANKLDMNCTFNDRPDAILTE